MFSFVRGSRDDNMTRDNCRLTEKLAKDRRVRIVHVCDIPEGPWAHAWSSRRLDVTWRRSA